MDGRFAIAVFVKTPPYSPVKTRLAKSIGKTKAVEVFYSLLEITKSVLSELNELRSDVDIFWAVAESDCLNNVLWKDYPTLWQGEGGLGTKLYNIQSKLLNSYEGIIFIGADAPFITSSLIIESIDFLKSQKLQQCKDKVAIGPSMDGGFYLYAANQKRTHQLWENITYSTSNTRDQLIDTFQIHSLTHYLPELHDIDTLRDLQLTYAKILEISEQKFKMQFNQHLKRQYDTFLDWMKKNLEMIKV